MKHFVFWMVFTTILLPIPRLAGAEEEASMTAASLKKLTPVLFVEKIEPCLPFWVERLGFKKTTEVPEGDALAFVMLTRDNVVVMLQTRASLAKDIPALADERSRSFLYIEVSDLEEFIQRLEGADIVVPVRETFYGAREISVRDPAGNVITFAAFKEDH